MIITIDYQNGEVVPDNLVVKFIRDKLKLNEDFSIGSEGMLLALRVEVKEGRYREDNIIEGCLGTVVIVEYESDLYYIKENGRMFDGFIPGSITESLLDILIGI